MLESEPHTSRGPSKAPVLARGLEPESSLPPPTPWTTAPQRPAEPAPRCRRARPLSICLGGNGTTGAGRRSGTGGSRSPSRATWTRTMRGATQPCERPRTISTTSTMANSAIPVSRSGALLDHREQQQQAFPAAAAPIGSPDCRRCLPVAFQFTHSPSRLRTVVADDERATTTSLRGTRARRCSPARLSSGAPTRRSPLAAMGPASSGESNRISAGGTQAEPAAGPGFSPFRRARPRATTSTIRPRCRAVRSCVRRTA